ncbi:hypothetical protein [Asticcacaulis endophyticus]|uniref:Uncharacterized protein n=1 Tax=Asticcacaulis endophyticus TaxID=1395890 RepID=A0A918PQS1_9CAUL|nr:hypothetical protein [Asticcacaulis endophyticus]GGZ19835.1 hypothetical protein GCM10011273_00480 [Asticcacaulis endophyticus]
MKSKPGYLSRLRYVLLALPLAVILYTIVGIEIRNALIGLVINSTNDGWVFTGVNILYYALVFPLMAVAALRSRALGWSPWLVLPMGFGVLIRYCSWWLFSDIAPQTWDMPPGSFEAMELMRVYGMCFVLLLAVWPERKARLAMAV